jgi:UDP-3-O-[3-hydroxymyristoyl] N-acetylglucosamine deacetylase
MMADFSGGYQTTISESVVISGTGVHSGRPVSLVLHPAEVDSGITFILRNDARRVIRISANFRAISNVTLCTILSGDDGASVATVEHLMAALRGMGIDNVDVEVDANEIPIMDGSAEPFVDALLDAGIRPLHRARRYIRVLKPVHIEDGDAHASLQPYDGFHLDVEIDFDTPVIGRQRWRGDLTPRVFVRALSRARTFGFMKDVKMLWQAGRALGSSLENTVAIGDEGIVNPDGLRFEDEFVRHKALDAVGDLSLAGAPLLGAFKSYRGGHRVNAMVLNALYADSSAWTVVEATTERRRHRELTQADSHWGVPMPAFAAEKS